MALYIYILLALLIVYLEVRRRLAGHAVDAMSVFNCYYLVLYALVPINVICFGADVVRQQYAYERFGYGDEFTALSLLLSYALFGFGYWVKSARSHKAANTGGGNFSYPLQSSASVAKIIFLLGVLTTVIYVVQMGGVYEAISKAAGVRSGEVVVESEFIGYRHFSQFSADAFVLLFAVLVGKKVQKTRMTERDIVFLSGAFLFFVYYALSTGGRRPFIYPIILCYLVYSSVGGRVKKLAVAAFAATFIVAGLGSMISTLDPVENAPALVEMVRDSDTGWRAVFTLAYDNASQGLADSFIHFVGAQKASLWQFGFLTDVANLPEDFLPSQVLGFKRSRQLSNSVTEFFLGQAPEEGIAGEETLGLHGYLLVNFGYIGMFALFFLLGMFYKWIHVRVKPADPKDAVGWLVYWWAVIMFFIYFREGALIFVVKTQLTWWITIGLLNHYYRRQERREMMSGLVSVG